MSFTALRRGWLNLSPGERGLLCGLLVGLPLVAGLVRVAGVMRAIRLIERLSPVSAADDPSPGEMNQAERLAQLVDIAGRRGLVTATCLRQSLLLYFLLRRRGLSPELRLGVRKDGGIFLAHAWIELASVPLGSGRNAHVPLGSLASRGVVA